MGRCPPQRPLLHRWARRALLLPPKRGWAQLALTRPVWQLALVRPETAQLALTVLPAPCSQLVRLLPVQGVQALARLLLVVRPVLQQQRQQQQPGRVRMRAAARVCPGGPPGRRSC